jgi:hypothetical protein
MYEWERHSPENPAAPPLQPKSAQEPKSQAALKSNNKGTNGSATAVTGKPSKPAPKEPTKEPPAQLASPRSTSSTASTAPTDAAPGEVHSTVKEASGDLGAPVVKLNSTQNPTTQELAKLLEMAGSRLANGDYGTAMQYLLFAQALSSTASENPLPDSSRSF